MDFATDFPRLEPAQQDRFRDVVTRLLSGHVLTPGTAMRPDADWRFAERHRELIDAYLRLGGWRLETDLGLRLCRAVHESGDGPVPLDRKHAQRTERAVGRYPPDALVVDEEHGVITQQQDLHPHR